MAYSSIDNTGGVVTYPEPDPGMPGPLLWLDPRQGLASNNTDQPFPKLGQRRRETGDRKFVYCLNDATAALVEGNLVTPIALASNATISMTTDTRGALTVLTGFSGLLPGQWVGGMAYLSAVSAGTADGSCRRIVANTATKVYVERPFPIDLTTSTATVLLYHPYQCKVSPAAGGITQKITGISYAAVPAATGTNMFTAGGVSYGGWVQYTGLCDQVKIGVAITVANAYLTASAATAGVAIGVGAGDVTTANVFGVLPAGMGGAAYDTFAPAYLTNCQG